MPLILIFFVQLKCDTNIKSLQKTVSTWLKDLVQTNFSSSQKIIWNERKISRRFWKWKYVKVLCFYVWVILKKLKAHQMDKLFLKDRKTTWEYLFHWLRFFFCLMLSKITLKDIVFAFFYFYFFPSIVCKIIQSKKNAYGFVLIRKTM